MQPKTSIGSRIAWFVIAAVILLATCHIGLRVLPAFKEVFASFGVKLPRGTKTAFTFGPAVLVSVGLIAAVLTVMGEFRPDLRWLRAPLILLVVFLMGSSLAAVVFVPPLRCGEIVSPPAPASTSPAQHTNAP